MTTDIPLEVRRCARFAADVFSYEVDGLSELEKARMAEDVLKRYAENTPAPSPASGEAKVAAEIGELPEGGQYGTCDWGDCDKPANRLRDGLPVCDECLAAEVTLPEGITIGGRRPRLIQAVRDSWSLVDWNNAADVFTHAAEWSSGFADSYSWPTRAAATEFAASKADLPKIDGRQPRIAEHREGFAVFGGGVPTAPDSFGPHGWASAYHAVHRWPTVLAAYKAVIAAAVVRRPREESPAMRQPSNLPTTLHEALARLLEAQSRADRLQAGHLESVRAKIERDLQAHADSFNVKPTADLANLLKTAIVGLPAAYQTLISAAVVRLRQVGVALTEAASRAEAAERVATLVLGSLRWTGDGYEWTGGEYDYRMKPEEAVRLMEAERAKLQARIGELEAALAKWQSDPLAKVEANPIDKIAADRGWLPLVPGERMTVHFNGIEYQVERRAQP